VDFPYLSCQLALGHSPDLPARYIVGHRTRWWLGDVDHALLRVFKRDRAPIDGAPSTWRVAADFVRASAPGVRNEIVRADDLAPAWRELRTYTRTLAGLLARRAWRPLARTRVVAPFGVERR